MVSLLQTGGFVVVQAACPTQPTQSVLLILNVTISIEVPLFLQQIF